MRHRRNADVHRASQPLVFPREDVVLQFGTRLAFTLVVGNLDASAYGDMNAYAKQHVGKVGPSRGGPRS